jgi:cytochrome P450
MQETLRMGCIAPLSVPHHADMDVPIFGGKLVIPAGTTVMPNLSYIVNNPKVFPNPEKFNPDRFLDSQGKYIKNEHNIIFGTGTFFIMDCATC